jgi:hypothetical protein
MTADVVCPLCHTRIAAVTDAERREADREARRNRLSLRDSVIVCTPCVRLRGVAVQEQLAMELTS